MLVAVDSFGMKLKDIRVLDALHSISPRHCYHTTFTITGKLEVHMAHNEIKAIDSGHTGDLIWRSGQIQVSDALAKPMLTELLRTVMANSLVPTCPFKETKRERKKRRKGIRDKQAEESA